jgi:hypothetical protein
MRRVVNLGKLIHMYLDRCPKVKAYLRLSV